MGVVDIVILGAGIPGHTSAMFAKRYLGKSANVLIPLAPVYQKHDIAFLQGSAIELYPQGRLNHSRPRKDPNGPSPPRTGMPSAIMGKLVAENIALKVKTGQMGKKSTSLGKIGAACIASIGSGLKKGAALSITMYPIVPDYRKYPNTGRDIKLTFGEVGRSGHWIKK
jgi:hypothetical protein